MKNNDIIPPPHTHCLTDRTSVRIHYASFLPLGKKILGTREYTGSIFLSKDRKELFFVIEKKKKNSLHKEIHDEKTFFSSL